MWGLGLVEGPARRREGSASDCEARDWCPDKRSVICCLFTGSCLIGYLQTLLLGWKLIIHPLYPLSQVHVPKWSRRRNQMQSVSCVGGTHSICEVHE